MMKTKKIPILLVAALSAATANAAIIYEPFDYAATGPLNDGVFLGDGNQSGALGLTGNWSQVNSGSNEIEVVTPGLTFTDSGSNVLSTTGGYAFRPNRVGQAAASSAVSASATAALTANNSTMWMSFLYVDRGFSGPSSAINLSSENMTFGDSLGLDTAGFGVGVTFRNTTGTSRAPHIAYFSGGTSATLAAGPDTFDAATTSDVMMYAMKVNWKEDGTADEMFLFNITDLTAEPDEADAIASSTFDMLLVNQQSLDVLNIGENQVDGFDEIRFGNTFIDVTPIPEPSSTTLLGLGGLALILRRRK